MDGFMLECICIHYVCSAKPILGDLFCQGFVLLIALNSGALPPPLCYIE